MSTFAADGPQHRNLSGSLEQREGVLVLALALAPASYHDSYYIQQYSVLLLPWSGTGLVS